MQIAPAGSTRGRGDQAAELKLRAQVDPIRAVYRGENVCGNPIIRPRSIRAAIMVYLKPGDIGNQKSRVGPS